MTANRTLTPREEGLPNINITSFAGIGSGNVTFNTNETSEVADSLSINRGRHNFKFGGQWRIARSSTRRRISRADRLTFSPDITGIPDAFAAFLLGIPLERKLGRRACPRMICTSRNSACIGWMTGRPHHG